MIQAAKILEQRSHLVPGKLRITEHFFQVPRDYSNPASGTIELFARSARKFEKPAAEKPEDPKAQPPWIVYLQGGPGFQCGQPQDFRFTDSLLEKGYQVLCLDQRGTGLSTAISRASLHLRGTEDVQTNYLKSFRADSIVKDCEAIRQALTAEYPEDQKKWSIMGQSFGGFCCTTYLSFYPEGVKEAFIFGGLPPARDEPDEVYERLYRRVKERNIQYYQKFPEDVERVKRIIRSLGQNGDTTVRVQGGEGYMTPRRFLQLGLMFGGHGGIDTVHDLVLRADTDLRQFGHVTTPTIMAIEACQSFDSNVLYALLHEPIYCSGPGQASNWSAHRMMQKYPEFNPDPSADGPILFTGEMIYPFMLECYPELRKLRVVGEMLAKASDWPKLYDWEQLAKNEVPVYAAVYYDDMYVDFDLSMETASKIKGCKTFLTNSMYHNAVRAKWHEVMWAVWALRDDVID